MAFQGQLGGAPLLFLGRGAGFGSVVNPMDGVGPPGQWRSIGVAGALVVDVPQQVGPAPLLGAIIMVVGSVAIADQYSGESIVQGFIHHRLAPAPPQEVAFGGGAESPHVAVGPALTPAGFVGPVSSARFRRPGFVGVDHRAGPDAVQYAGYHRLGLWRRLTNGPDDGARADAPLLYGIQIPLDGGEGHSRFFP